MNIFYIKIFVKIFLGYVACSCYSRQLLSKHAINRSMQSTAAVAAGVVVGSGFLWACTLKEDEFDAKRPLTKRAPVTVLMYNVTFLSMINMTLCICYFIYIIIYIQIHTLFYLFKSNESPFLFIQKEFKRGLFQVK